MRIEQITIPSATDVPSGSVRVRVPASSSRRSNESFLEILKDSVKKVNELQKQADAAIDDLIVGNSKDIAQTVITMEKAEIAFRLMTQVRNKIIQAYEEIMRMQV
jgi:flagellar hook-basal body complex protein FliE